MTIRRGDDWGRVVPRPARLRCVDSDRALAAALTDGTDDPVLVSGGDLARTLGSTADRDCADLNELPIDLLEVTLDAGTFTAAAHVVARLPRRAGSWYRGEVVFVMNAQFLDTWNLIPRGHPNDGRADVLRVEPALPARQRIEAARRAPTAAHLPHPGLALTRVRQTDFAFERPMEVLVDGERVGGTRRLGVVVLGDAAVVHC